MLAQPSLAWACAGKGAEYAEPQLKTRAGESTSSLISNCVLLKPLGAPKERASCTKCHEGRADRANLSEHEC